jgi:hypothetical protein
VTAANQVRLVFILLFAMLSAAVLGGGVAVLVTFAALTVLAPVGVVVRRLRKGGAK